MAWRWFQRGLAYVPDVLFALMLIGPGCAAIYLGAVILLTHDLTRPPDIPPANWQHLGISELVLGLVFLLAAAFKVGMWVGGWRRNERMVKAGRQ